MNVSQHHSPAKPLVACRGAVSFLFGQRFRDLRIVSLQQLLTVSERFVVYCALLEEGRPQFRRKIRFNQNSPQRGARFKSMEKFVQIFFQASTGHGISKLEQGPYLGGGFQNAFLARIRYQAPETIASEMEEGQR